MTSIRLFVTVVSAALIAFAGDSWPEEIQFTDDADSLPIEEDSSNIESKQASLDEPQGQEDREERTQTPDSFEPTEAISEDIAVPFPVDI